jgi:predicted nucleotide-binding protein
MPKDAQYLFVSYARPDVAHVLPLVDAVRAELEARALPVQLWIDQSDLIAGQQWDLQIQHALGSSIGMLVFVSPRSLQSEWVVREVTIAAESEKRLIIPIFLQWPLRNLPHALEVRQGIMLTPPVDAEHIVRSAIEIANSVEAYLAKTPLPRPAVSRTEAPTIAAEIARDVRASIHAKAAEENRNSVFVVHGHDLNALGIVEEYLTMVGITAVVLSRQEEHTQSLLQRFLAVAGRAGFAIVLLTADDRGASREQYDVAGIGEKAIQFRARQNVILELGFFYGQLGFENVFVIHQKPDLPWPNFERPSDLDGVLFDNLSDPAWRKKLGQRLLKAGFELSAPSQ